MRTVTWMMLGLALCIGACSRQENAPRTSASSAIPTVGDAGPSLAALNRGARLFQENCAQCHGPEGQGHPDWQTPGVVAAPPLNGTGNDVKRTRKELLAVIHDGVKRNGVIVMPAWKGRLSEAEINDVVAWFQALWPPEIYSKWQLAHTAKTGGR